MVISVVCSEKVSERPKPVVLNFWLYVVFNCYYWTFRFRWLPAAINPLALIRAS